MLQSEPSLYPYHHMVMWEASNEALLAGFVTGDPDAAAAFIRRFQRRVFGLARSIVGDPGLA